MALRRNAGLPPSFARSESRGAAKLQQMKAPSTHGYLSQQIHPGPSPAALTFVASLAAKADGHAFNVLEEEEGLRQGSSSWNRLVQADPPTVQAWIAEQTMKMSATMAASDGKCFRAFRGATLPESTLCREVEGEPPIPGLRQPLVALPLRPRDTEASRLDLASMKQGGQDSSSAAAAAAAAELKLPENQKSDATEQGQLSAHTQKPVDSAAVSGSLQEASDHDQDDDDDDKEEEESEDGELDAADVEWS